MGAISIEGVTKMFPGGVAAVDDATLDIEDGEFLVLVGPSGCGKTTLLRMLAGLEYASSGSIRIGGRDMTRVAARDRDIAMVFQNYALYPHMTVRENLGFCLKMQKMSKSDTRSRVEEVAQMLGLKDMLARKPSELSGGQRQRVAMGRAIVREPQAFLMDEPLSNLDAKLRVGMRTELARLHDRLSTTTVYVTHDQVEAMTLGQRVAVMHDGRILQVDSPQTIYAQPDNLFVGAFIGSPSMNLVEATIDGDAVTFGGFRFPLGRDRRPRIVGTRVIVGIRPESFEDAAVANRGLPEIEVDVEVLEELGSDTHIVFRVDAPQVELAEVRAASEGESNTLLAGERTILFNARVDPSTAARPGGRVRLSVDPSTFHFFDAESHLRLRDS